MAWSFRKRIKIAPGVNLNLSKSGVSTSVGPKGAKINVGPKGEPVSTIAKNYPAVGHRKADEGNRALGISEGNGVFFHWLCGFVAQR